MAKVMIDGMGGYGVRLVHRRERRARSFWHHECLAVRMGVVACLGPGEQSVAHSVYQKWLDNF